MTLPSSGPDARSGAKSSAAFTPPDAERAGLESQLRECFGRCAYTHKTHEKMADSCAMRLKRLKWGQIFVSALTTAGAVGIVFDRASVFFTYGTLLFSVGMLILNSYAKDLNPGAEAQKHRDAAADLWNVRESYLSLLTDIRDPTVQLAKLRTRRDELQAQLHKIYKSAPRTDDDAYGRAQTALKDNEELTFSDAEIDAFLPSPLRRTLA
jgi:SMODS and SLOG-associating 2TM effector domain family 4